MILPMENTEKMIFPGVGKYGIPEIKPETDIRIDKLEWIPVNYALTAYWQAHGIHVIPTLCWCGEQSYDWCFDGEPRNAIVSISSHGTQSDPYEAA